MKGDDSPPKKGGNRTTYSFDNGIIDANGNLVAQLREDIKINLGLYREKGKMKLYGNYSHGQIEGTLTLYKKMIRYFFKKI